MGKRIVNNINLNYNQLTKNHHNRHFFFINENYSENNLKKENKINKIKQHTLIMHDSIPSSFSKIENINNVKEDEYQFEYQNESHKNMNNKNKSIKVSLLSQKMNNLMIIKIFIIIIFLKGCKLSSLYAHSSNITIKINETGMQKIFFGDPICYKTKPKFSFPDEVIINGEKQLNVTSQYNFTRADNIIKLVWYESGENWGCLFKFCDKITEIDFLQFDFSKRIQAQMLFYQCKSLTSLNINDFDKVRLTDAGSCFRDLTSLTSLNLSNFDMSEVTDIGWMFAGCTSLTSLDLSNFHTNNVTVNVTFILELY